MRDINIALSRHLYQVSIAELVGNIPTDIENDDGTIKMAITEERG
jgi:hypothetical protein